MRPYAAVVLGNAGTSNDVDVLTRALDDEEPLVRQHAAWALARIAARVRDTPGTGADTQHLELVAPSGVQG
jgi:epoxyqueuosine reductase